MGVCASVFKERMWFYAHHAGFRVCFFVGVVSIFLFFASMAQKMERIFM